MTPDWSSSPVLVPYADLGNPQTFNLYSYVANNPLNTVDPEGHFRLDPGTENYNDPDTGAPMYGPNATQNANAAAQDVQVNVTEQSYTVHGDNVDAAISAANSGSATGCTGGAGCTTPTYHYEYDVKPESVQSGEKTSVTVSAINVSVSVEITVKTPTWAEYNKASASEQKTWDAMTNKLKSHEEGHVERDKAGAREMKDAIKGTKATGTGESPGQALAKAQKNLKVRVDGKADAVKDAVDKRNDAYDLATRHGRD